MSTVRQDVAAICVADIHLSLNPPLWRSNESDWFAAMKRSLDEIVFLQKEYDCPVLCAGDIFHKWNSLPEVVNFAIDNLPDKMYCIPGQHDLPLHNLDDIEKSAYWTLVQAGKITNINDLINIASSEITLYGTPFGKKIKPITHESTFLQIAVVHEYTWIKGHSYPGASKDSLLGYKAVLYHDQKWKGYDIVIYGDNHKGFQATNNKKTTWFWNCGSLMRRNSDQINYNPRIGIIYKDGTMAPQHLQLHNEKYLEISDEHIGEDLIDLKQLIRELEKLDSNDLDFREMMEQHLKKNNINKSICNIILKAMGM